MAERVGFIGAGKLATGLAMAMLAHGYTVTAVASRSIASARRLAGLASGVEALSGPCEVAQTCDLVFITTPDTDIEQVSEAVQWRAGQGVVHCSGALSLGPLASAARAGALVASFHPLQTLACIETPQEAAHRLSAICYAMEAEGWLAAYLERLAADLGGHVIKVAPEDRPLYHQAAVFACGYVTALLEAAEEIWVQIGFLPHEARAALAPLAQTTVTNYHRAGAKASVTGPIARGDADTVERQMEALRTRLPGLAPLAGALGLRSLTFAPPHSRRRLAELLHSSIQESDQAPTPTPGSPTTNRSER